MAEPLRIRFATDTAPVKSAMQDVAANVVSNMVKISGSIANNTEAAGAAAKKMGEHFGTGAQGIRAALTTVVTDAGAIAQAAAKAANDTGGSIVGTANAIRAAAAETKTGIAAQEIAIAAAAASGSATLQKAKTEAVATGKVIGSAVAETGKIILSSPLFRNVLIVGGTFLATKLAIDAVTAAARLAAEKVEKLVKIGDRASSAGVSSSFLQSFEGQADKLKLKLEDVDKILKRLKTDSTLKLSEANDDGRNQSDLEKRLRELQKLGNLTKGDVSGITGAADNEERFKRLLTLMDRLIDRGNTLTALDIGSRFLPEEMVNRIRENRTELETLIKVANTQKKGIFTDEEISQAQELDRRLKEATKTLSDGLLPIYQDLARRGREFHQSNVEWVEFLAARIPQIIQAYNDLASALQRYSNTAAAATKIGVSGAAPSTLNPALAGALTQAASGGSVAPTTDMDRAKEYIRQNMNPSAIAAQQKRGQAIVDAVNPVKDNPFPKTAKSGGGASESQDQVESYIQSLERSTAALKAEAEAYNLSGAEKQKAIVLARAEEIAKQRGTAITEEEIRKLTAVGAAAGTARDKIAELQQQSQLAAEAMRTLGDTAVDSLYGMIAEGKSASDVMQDLTKILIKAALQAAIMGTGPLAGLFGTAPAPGATGASSVGGFLGLVAQFIPKFAAGTDYAPGGLSLVGENGPELVNLSRGAQVIPNHVLSGLGRLNAVPSPEAIGGGSFRQDVAVSAGDIHVAVSGDGVTMGQVTTIVERAQRRQQQALAGMVQDLFVRGKLR